MKAIAVLALVSLALCGCKTSQNQVATESPGLAGEGPVAAAAPDLLPYLEKIKLTPGQVKSVKEAVTSQLQDPASAQFHPMAAGQEQGGGNISVCGKVNAKSAVGGHTGFTSYYVEADPQREDSAMLLSYGSTELDELAIVKKCKDFGLPYS